MILSKKKLSFSLMLILSAAIVTGCETTKTSVCKPIFPSANDIVTKGTMQQIVTHNESLARNK